MLKVISSLVGRPWTHNEASQLRSMTEYASGSKGKSNSHHTSSPEPEARSLKKQKLSAPRLHQSPWKKGGRKEEMKVLLHSKFQLLSLFLSVLISGRSHDFSSRLLPIVPFSVNFLGPLACLPAFAWQHQLLLLFCPLPFPFIPGPSLLVRPNLRRRKKGEGKEKKTLCRCIGKEFSNKCILGALQVRCTGFAIS